ncbi:MAG TPA: M14 family zinc carboxypeptidase [Tepidisphaeraceae bacterium]|nr:M14 family zinc carboxypeptidase [Tepidisphaeraceae bacterium]
MPRALLLATLLLTVGCATAPPSSPAPVPSSLVPTLPPPVRALSLGHSVDGRPLTLHLLGDPADPAPLLIVGGVHGNEPTATAVAQRLLELLTAQPALLGRRRVAILPCANPDGLARKLRTNTNLVDLNRNLPAANWAKTRKGAMFGGHRPSSEPETLALLKAFETVRPARVISIHSMAAPCNNYDGPAQLLAQTMARLNAFPVKASIGYPTPGSLGSWAGVDKQIPTITLELPSRASADAAWEQNREALLAAISEGESKNTQDMSAKNQRP